MNIYMTDIPPENIVYTAPKYKTAMTIKEVIEATEYREYPRLKNNYKSLLKAIKDIGVNYKEYVK